MDFSKLMEKSQEAVGQAQSLASRRGVLLEQEGGLTEKMLARLGLGVALLKGRLERHLANVPSVEGEGAGARPIKPMQSSSRKRDRAAALLGRKSREGRP
jgi:hypothetical protein